MKNLRRPLSALLFSVCFATTSLSGGHMPQAYAQATPVASPEAARALMQAVRAAVQQNPALADGVGQRALLNGVHRAVAANPAMKPQIVAAAKTIRPNLAAQIDRVANLPSANPQMVQTAPAQPAAPASTAGTASAGGAAAAGGATAGIGTHALIGLVSVAAVAGGVGAALGSSGGSGGGGSAEPTPAPETEEYLNQWGLSAIKASWAYGRGGTGQGVKVAVADTGLNTTHTDIDDNTLPEGYNFPESNNDVTDDFGHGSHVAGIIGAERDGNAGANNMHGVAYNADILPLLIFEDDGGGNAVASVANIIAATNYARTENAQVFNGSYGPDYSNPLITQQTFSNSDDMMAAAYQDAADSGMLLVFSAGNDYNDNPTVAVNPTGAAMYPYVRPANAGSGVYVDGGNNYDFSGLEDNLIAVVATQQNGSIASYSNRCGLAASWCIAAPGSNILSLSNVGNGYATMSGTSMAAPHVSGALAILIEMFPELQPDEIVERLFISANKTGIYADDTIYGQGFLDLEKATRPIGALSVMTGNSVQQGNSFALSSSNLNLGPAFGDGLQAALVGQKLAVFDQQNATFVVDIGDFTRTADSRFNMDEALRRFRSRFGEQTIQLGDGASLSYAMVNLGRHDSTINDPALGDHNATMEMAYSQTVGDMRMNMQYNINPSAMFGIHQSKMADSNAMLSRDAFAAPYLSFAKQGYSMGSHIPLNDAFTLNVASFKGYGFEDELRRPEDRAESYGHMAELGYTKGDFKLFSQMGMLTEEQSFLGSRSEGAFDLDSGTQTSFAGVNAVYHMTDRWSLVGSYYTGVSSPQLDGTSLFEDVSDVQTQSFSVGMMGEGVFYEGDTFGLVGNQPLRVTDGEASMSLATGRSSSGMLYNQRHDINLAPSGRELNLEAFYHFSLPDSQTQLMSALMYRNEPGHIENAPDEGLLLLQLQQPF